MFYGAAAAVGNTKRSFIKKSSKEATGNLQKVNFYHKGLSRPASNFRSVFKKEINQLIYICK